MFSAKLLALLTLQPESWTVTHAILAQDSAAAHAKVFAGQTLRTKVGLKLIEWIFC